MKHAPEAGGPMNPCIPEPRLFRPRIYAISAGPEEWTWLILWHAGWMPFYCGGWPEAMKLLRWLYDYA